MIYTEKIKMGIKDIEKDLYLGNRAILEYLENVACHHADSIGCGTASEGNTTAWLLLDWKVQVLQRPTYGQELTVTTWSRDMVGCFGFRDYKITDEAGTLCIIATSKWLLVDTQTKAIRKVDKEVMAKYESEPDHFAFPSSEDEKFEKLRKPEAFDHSVTYPVVRRDLDFMGHMHNIYYLDLAYEALPEEVYAKRLIDNFRISYSKEIKPGQVVHCRYALRDGKYTVVLENEDGSLMHAIVEMY